MGQHKFNETAKLAKEGKLPPKPRKKGKWEQRREMAEMIRKATGRDDIKVTVGDREI